MPWRKNKVPKLVRETEAKGRTLQIFNQIKRCLGVPHINVIFQAYAAHPIFLDRYWKAMAPLCRSQEFFALSQRLGADAYTRAHNYLPIPNLASNVIPMRVAGGSGPDLAGVVELVQYNNPLLLMLATAQIRAFEQPPAVAGTARHPAQHPQFKEKPVLVEEEDASPEIKKTYEDIKRTLGLCIVDTGYRALARWPDFLVAYWQVLKPVTRSPLYQECQHCVRESAWALSAELPQVPQLTLAQMEEAGMDDEEITEVVQLTEKFVSILSGLLLNVAFAKIGLEGGNAAEETWETELPLEAA